MCKYTMSSFSLLRCSNDPKCVRVTELPSIRTWAPFGTRSSAEQNESRDVLVRATDGCKVTPSERPPSFPAINLTRLPFLQQRLRGLCHAFHPTSARSESPSPKPSEPEHLPLLLCACAAGGDVSPRRSAVRPYVLILGAILDTNCCLFLPGCVLSSIHAATPLQMALNHLHP